MLYFEVSRDYIGNDFVVLRPSHFIFDLDRLSPDAFEELDDWFNNALYPLALERSSSDSFHDIKKYYLVTKTNKTRFTSFEELDKLVTSINIAEQKFVVKLQELSSLSTEITDEIIQKWNNNDV